MGLGNIGNYIDENFYKTTPVNEDAFSHPEMPIEENKVRVVPSGKRVIKKKKALSRELMKGLHKPEILQKYGDFFSKYNVLDKAIAFLDQNDGLIGYFVVDVSAFDNKFGYNDIPAFMRSCNLYAINSDQLQEIKDVGLVSENNGTLDGFLNSNETPKCEVRYVDSTTGLPVVENASKCFDDNDDRLQKIADLFLRQNLIKLGDHARFGQVKGKLPYLVALVKSSLKPKSAATGKHENLVSDYQVKAPVSTIECAKKQKAQAVNGLSELKVDDIGDVSMPEKVHVSRKFDASELKKDVDLNAKQVASVDENELNSLEATEDVIDFDKVSNEIDISTKASIDVSAEDVKVGKKPIASVDEGEFFALDSDKDVIDFDKVQDEIEVSSKSEWNF